MTSTRRVRAWTLAISAFLLIGALEAPTRAADLDRAPASVLAGPSTGIVSPAGIATDRQRNRYIANLGDSSVAIFSPNATGDAPPSRVYSGPATTLVSPRAVAPTGDGTIYVADYSGAGTQRILAFSTDEDGNVAPTRVIGGPATGLGIPSAITLGKAGKLYVANISLNSITVYAADAAGNAAPLRTISGAATGLADPSGLAVDKAGVLHVSNYDSSTITAYAPGANGNAAPIRTISGPRTQLSAVEGLALDSRGNIYVTDGNAPSVIAFAAKARGNVRPLARLIGDDIDLVYPAGLTADRRNRISVSDTNGAKVLTFAPILPDLAGAVRRLDVSGRPASAERRVTWRAPKVNGSAPVTGYRLVVSKGDRVLITKSTSAGKRSVTLRRSALAGGRNTVTVRALNKEGAGKRASIRFTVLR